MPRSLAGQVAIVGLGTTAVGSLPGRTAVELTVEASLAAVRDAGLQLSDVDGIYTSLSRVDPFGTGSAVLSEHLGIFPSFAISMPVGGMQVTAALYQAAAMIYAGIANVVLVACADNLLTGYGRGGAVDHYADTGHPDYETPFGTHIPSLYALIAQRHMHDYGTTKEQMAAVAVQMRSNASQHPEAQMRTPITVQDVLESRPIAAPFNLLDCSLISDGGVAFVLTSSERARDLKNRPVVIAGAGEGRAHQNLSESKSLSRFAAPEASARAFSMAGLGPSDMDVALLYDPFTISPILSLEALGFCPFGEGGLFVADGNIAPTGTIPVNPHGGLLSHAHPGRPGGVMLAAEAVQQLRGEARGIQIPDVSAAVVQANAGITSGEVTLVLSH